MLSLSRRCSLLLQPRSKHDAPWCPAMCNACVLTRAGSPICCEGVSVLPGNAILVLPAHLCPRRACPRQVYSNAAAVLRSRCLTCLQASTDGPTGQACLAKSSGGKGMPPSPPPASPAPPPQGSTASDGSNTTGRAGVMGSGSDPSNAPNASSTSATGQASGSLSQGVIIALVVAGAVVALVVVAGAVMYQRRKPSHLPQQAQVGSLLLSTLNSWPAGCLHAPQPAGDSRQGLHWIPPRTHVRLPQLHPQSC
jgi:hypothetical protein